MKDNKKIENRLTSELSNMIAEFKLKTLTEGLIYSYFSNFMCYAEVDSEIVVNVLERFGEAGKNEALNIKINEGW